MMVSANLMISRPKPRPKAKMNILCFPFAGGGATYFYPWVQQLPADIELIQVLLPGRERRLKEPLISDIKVLVGELALSFPLNDERPFAFFGHSMGALVAFELCHLLRKEGDRLPAQLLLSGFRAPHLPDREPPLSQLRPLEFIESLRRIGGTPEAVFQNKELLDLFLPILRADFALLDNYQYTWNEPLDLPITAFGGLSDPRTTPEEIEAWRKHTGHRFNSHFFPGGHFFISEHQDALLDRIVAALRVGVS